MMMKFNILVMGIHKMGRLLMSVLSVYKIKVIKVWKS